VNLREIVKTFRREIKDTAKPYLITDEAAMHFANQAQLEAARRGRLLVDSVTTGICEVQVSAGEPVVDIDPRIISIRRARISSRSIPLGKRKVRDMDFEFGGWDASTNKSIPTIVITDYGTDQLYLYPAPKDDCTLFLTVTREPLDAMSDDDDQPEIKSRHHLALISWMKYRAYSDDDTDLYNADKASRALTEFAAEFGQPISATDEQFEFENYYDVGER
jgi:hypothetical protein